MGGSSAEEQKQNSNSTQFTIFSSHSYFRTKNLSTTSWVSFQNAVLKVGEAFYSMVSPELELLRRFLDAHPLLSIGIVFLIGVIFGGLLRAWPSQFVLLSLLGGFGLAIAHGATIGLPAYVSVALVVPILAFATYATLSVLRSVEQYSRAAPYLTHLKRKYLPISSYLLARAGPIGITDVLAFSTFLIGWWVTVMMAYLLNARVSSTMKGTGVGLGVGAFVFWASYQGLLRWIPNPITALTLIVFFAIGRLMLQKAEHEAQTSPT